LGPKVEHRPGIERRIRRKADAEEEEKM
jgi:hypothetical protein